MLPRWLAECWLWLAGGVLVAAVAVMWWLDDDGDDDPGCGDGG